jgi:hypothetical protein
LSKSVLARLTSFIGLLDSTIRRLDFRVSRTVGGPLERCGVSRYTWAAVALPTAITFFLVNGPALRMGPPRLLLAAGVAAFAARLVLLALWLSNCRRWPMWIDLIIQVAIVCGIGAAVWLASAPGDTQQNGGVYRHIDVPLAAIVSASALAAAALAAALFRSKGARDSVPHRLTVVELFVVRPPTHMPTWGMLGVAFVGVLTSALGRQLLPP